MDLDPESGIFLIASQPFSMPAEPEWYQLFLGAWALENRGPAPGWYELDAIPTFEAWQAAGGKGTYGNWERECCPYIGEVVSFAHAFRDGRV